MREGQGVREAIRLVLPHLHPVDQHRIEAVEAVHGHFGQQVLPRQPGQVPGLSRPLATLRRISGSPASQQVDQRHHRLLDLGFNLPLHGLDRPVRRHVGAAAIDPARPHGLTVKLGLHRHQAPIGLIRHRHPPG